MRKFETAFGASHHPTGHVSASGSLVRSSDDMSQGKDAGGGEIVGVAEGGEKEERKREKADLTLCIKSRRFIAHKARDGAGYLRHASLSVRTKRT